MKLAPGRMGCWVTRVPSMSLRSATPCQCTLVGCGIRLVNVARTVSPLFTRITGPGTVPS